MPLCDNNDDGLELNQHFDKKEIVGQCRMRAQPREISHLG